jgi:hypothetical protein
VGSYSFANSIPLRHYKVGFCLFLNYTTGFLEILCRLLCVCV